MSETQATIIPTRDKTHGLEFDPKNNIYLSLSKAQGKFKQPELNRTAVVKDKDGRVIYTTHYADLNQCIECVRSALSENGLSFTHTIDQRDKMWLLILTLRHDSGQLIESCMPVNPALSNQQFGGQLTYLKRYQLSAFFGLAADFDDDGNFTEGKSADIKPKDPTPDIKPKEQNKYAPKALPQTKAADKSAPKSQDKPKDPHPDVEPQKFPKDDTEPMKDNDPANYVVNIGAKLDGKKLSQISEKDLRQMSTWIDDQLKKTPPPKNIAALFDLKTCIGLFFKSVDVKF